MARFFGVVGYGDPVEEPPDSGVVVPNITEREYYGNVLRNSRELVQGNQGNKLNKDIVVSNSISVMADDHAIQFFHKILYVRWEGVNWSVDSAEVQRPRLILTLGGVYNGPTA